MYVSYNELRNTPSYKVIGHKRDVPGEDEEGDEIESEIVV